jgi:hypothetical protein
MKGKLTKKEWEEKEREDKVEKARREREKSTGMLEEKHTPVQVPYFPERMPKIGNLSKLISILIGIIQSLAETINPTDTSLFETKIDQVFSGTIDGINKIRLLLCFMIRNGPHYKKALNEVRNVDQYQNCIFLLLLFFIHTLFY